jgi:hypothetical protein
MEFDESEANMKPPVEAALGLHSMPSAMTATPPPVVMPVASTPSIMMTATTATHVSVTMTMAAFYENDALFIAGERIRFCYRYRKRR